MHSPRLVSVASALLSALATALLSPSAVSANPGAEVRLSAQLGLRASAVSGPVIAVSPASYDFGRVNVGESAAFDLTIRNDGDATLTISGVTHSGPGFSATAGSLSIPAGGAPTPSSTYTPPGRGPPPGNITNRSDARNRHQLVLLGDGGIALDSGRRVHDAFEHVHALGQRSPVGQRHDRERRQQRQLSGSPARRRQ